MKKTIVTEFLKVCGGLILLGCLGCSTCVCDGVSSAYCPACHHFSVDCPRFNHSPECSQCLRTCR